MSSARQVAADIIGRVLNGESLNQLLPAALDAVADGQRPLCQELVYGTLREWPMLQGIIDRFVKKPLRKKDHDVLALLGSALYEFTQLSTPKACRSFRNRQHRSSHEKTVGIRIGQRRFAVLSARGVTICYRLGASATESVTELA